MKGRALCYPSKNSFPSISITGEECHFSCMHCNAKYLRFMTQVKQTELYEKALELENKGAKGILISGGLDKFGRVPIDYSILGKIKKNTGLLVNLHSGFITKNDAKKIKKSNIDLVSIDFVGSNETIKRILNMPFKVSDYENTLRVLLEEDINVIPHICVGLDRGKIVGEYNAIEILKRYPIRSLTLLVLIKNELEKNFKVNYDFNGIMEFFVYVRKSFPNEILSLGCMRPRVKELDESALLFDNIAYPTKNMIKLIRNQGDMSIRNICCSMC